MKENNVNDRNYTFRIYIGDIKTDQLHSIISVFNHNSLIDNQTYSSIVIDYHFNTCITTNLNFDLSEGEAEEYEDEDWDDDDFEDEDDFEDDEFDFDEEEWEDEDFDDENWEFDEDLEIEDDDDDDDESDL